MNQRAWAAVLAMPLVAAMAVVALFKPLPYTTYAPGPTIDVLGAPDGKEIIQLPDGHKTYRDDGQLRMTTVSVTPKENDLNLFQVMGAWLDRDDAVYPKEAVYPDDKTADQVRDEGQVQMVSSQDTAVAVALKALGETVTPSLEVTLVGAGSPADGALVVRDLIRKVNGTPLSDDIGEGLRGAARRDQVDPARRSRSRSRCSATARRSTSRSRPRSGPPTCSVRSRSPARSRSGSSSARGSSCRSRSRSRSTRGSAVPAPG